MFPERNCKEDHVGLKRIPQRLGDDRCSNRSSLRRQLLGRPATRDGDFHVLPGEGMGEGLAYLAESQLRSSYALLWFTKQTRLRNIEWSAIRRVCQICASPPSTASSLAVMKLLSSDARKAAAAPISAGSAMRWSGVIEA